MCKLFHNNSSPPQSSMPPRPQPYFSGNIYKQKSNSLKCLTSHGNELNAPAPRPPTVSSLTLCVAFLMGGHMWSVIPGWDVEHHFDRGTGASSSFSSSSSRSFNKQSAPLCNSTRTRGGRAGRRESYPLSVCVGDHRDTLNRESMRPPYKRNWFALRAQERCTLLHTWYHKESTWLYLLTRVY